MPIPNDKIPEHKSRFASNEISNEPIGSESTLQFEDNRSESMTQLKLQKMANNNSRVSQLRAFQRMANNSFKGTQVGQLQSQKSDSSSSPIQKQGLPTQLKESHEMAQRENETGLPDILKTGMENLSGVSLDDVKVHRNSEKPAQLQAHAYAQGTDIHLGPGQEKQLPHEAWHVVQQKQGRVKPTMQMKANPNSKLKPGVNINDDSGLEKEADVMGAKAVQLFDKQAETTVQRKLKETGDHSPHVKETIQFQNMDDSFCAEEPSIEQNSGLPVQRKVGFEFETTWPMAATIKGTGPPNGLAGGDNNEVDVPIKKELGASGGWSFHADYHGGPVIEFVTEPIEEANWLTLFKVMSSLESMTGKIVGQAGIAGRDGNWISAKKFSGAEVWTLKSDDQMIAAPQMTAGFRLDRIPQVMDVMGDKASQSIVKQNPGAEELLAKPDAEGATRIANYLNMARSKARGFRVRCDKEEIAPTPDPLGVAMVPDPKYVKGSDDFQGALSLLGMYVILGQSHGPLDYAKELSPLMARSNLGLIPKEVRAHPRFIEGVLYVGGVRDASGLLLPNGFVGGTTNNLTIDAWLKGIIAGKDLLKGFSGGDMSNLDRTEGVDVHSVVGEHDIIDVPRAQGLIIELRGLKENLPRTKWREVAEHLQKWVLKINATSNTGTPKYDKSGGYD